MIYEANHNTFDLNGKCHSLIINRTLSSIGEDANIVFILGVDELKSWGSPTTSQYDTHTVHWIHCATSEYYNLITIEGMPNV